MSDSTITEAARQAAALERTREAARLARTSRPRKSVRSAAAAAPAVTEHVSDDGPGPDSRPVVAYSPGNLPADVAEAQAVLHDCAWQRGGEIVYIGISPEAPQGGRLPRLKRPVDSSVILPHNVDSLTLALGERRQYQILDRRSDTWKTVNPPPALVRGVLGAVGKWTLDPLVGLASCPLLREDGSIISTPGYDRETGIYAAFDAEEFAAVPVPESPSREDAERALLLLEDAVRESHFVGPVDRSVAEAAMLTAVSRPCLPSAPMIAFTAPTPGSGKSALCDLISIMATGKRASMIDAPPAEEELRKAIFAALRSGDRVVVLDNIPQGMVLNSPSLNIALSQPSMQQRILGESATATVSTKCLWLCSGNNLQIADDQVRRTLLCRLDANEERPSEHVYQRDLLKWGLEHRAPLVAAALMVLRAYHVAGRPNPPSPYNGFSEWSALVRGALLWLDRADPLESQQAIQVSDPMREARLAVFSAWHDAWQDKPVTAGTLLAKDPATPEREELLAVLEEHIPHRGDLNARTLGNWLKRNCDVLVGGYKLLKYDPDKSSAKGGVLWVMRSQAGQDG